MKRHVPAIILSFILFILPFFWLAPGQMDLGGDSNRLYFYDPVSFIKYTSMYDVFIGGKGAVDPSYYFLPYVGLIALLKSVFSSSTAVINFFNGVKLSIGFAAVYLTVHELLKKPNRDDSSYAAAIFAGLLYVVSFSSSHMAYFWNRAITSHNQIFLNPLIFYLLLKFIHSQKHTYLWTAILVSFLFAPNFGLTGAPPFFAFYPLMGLFFLLYVTLIQKKTFPWKSACAAAFLFLGVQAFQLLGQMVNLLDKGSFWNQRVFSKDEIAGGLQYFMAVRGNAKAVLSLLMPSAYNHLQWISFLAPLVVLIGFLLSKHTRRTMVFISLFFLVTLFLTTANITNVGLEFYKKLFFLPGFSMFRNFHTQWMFVFIFYYALLFGVAAYNVLAKLKPKYSRFFQWAAFFLLIITGIPLFLGEPVTKSIIRRSNNVPVVFRMDPRFEQTLDFIRKLPDDGKILVLPLTDFFYQVVYGKDGGAYEGPSMITHLAGKYNFVGYQLLGYNDESSYAEQIMKYSKEKDYAKLLRIFNVLNIRYILHNADPNAYEAKFSPGPFGYMQTAMPTTQKAYEEYLTHFPLKRIYQNNPYVIYELDKEVYNPTVFIPKGVYQSTALSFDEAFTHSVFLDDRVCTQSTFQRICNGAYTMSHVSITVRQINPTRYAVTVMHQKKPETMLLVMQHAFHTGWKLVLDKKIIGEKTHVPVNGYANGWLLTESDIPERETYTLFIQLEPQKYFWYGLSITAFSLTIVLILLGASLMKKHDTNE